MNRIWPYLNDLKQSRIEAVYALNNLIELVYTKEGRTKSATFCFHVQNDALGYIETFRCDGIPLPPAKGLHPLNGAFKHLLECRLYVKENAREHFEELELLTDQGNYLLYFDTAEKKERYAMIEKDKFPSLFLEEALNASLPKELFSVEYFKENLAFALLAHGEQKTPHGLPYAMHLLSVAGEVINAFSMQPLSYDEHNVAIACALLHDVNEDTSTMITRDTPLAGNAEVIAKGVSALTKDKTLPSKEAQMRDSIERLKKRQNCVALVKLADRITNLGVPPSRWDAAKKRAYVDEAKLILQELGYAHAYLADTLRDKITAYEAYM
jgi:hypothetical protein